MDKSILLEEMERFATHHEKKIQELELHFAGIPIGEEMLCRPFEKCSMMVWLRDNEKLFEQLYGVKKINKLYSYIEEWHKENSKICQYITVQHEKKTSLIEKILHGKKQEKKKKKYLENKDKIDVYIDNLRYMTEKIGRKLRVMKQRLIEMPEEKLREKYND